MNTNNTRNTRNTRKLRQVSVSRSPSPVPRPIRARLNTQSAFVGLDTPKVAEAMNMSSVAKQVQIQNNTQKSRPSSATLQGPIRPQSASYTRPKSATLHPIQMMSEQSHHGQLKTIHPNLQRQEGSRRLISTRRRKARKNRRSRRN